MNFINKFRILSIITCIITVTSCTQHQVDRLAAVGEEPALKTVENPMNAPTYRPVSWPVPDASADLGGFSKNSLWTSNSKTFFLDPRARNVGDIVIVNVSIDDRAELANKSERTRDSTESLELPRLFGYESLIGSLVPGGGTPSAANLLDLKGASEASGEGSIDREETIQAEIAAVITQVLPNRNMVIYGTQEIKVNFEVRQIAIHGVIRPEDISADNSIDSSKIAEARISYGGRGHISDVQQPRLGTQVIDILSPF